MKPYAPFLNPLCVALDVDDREVALDLAQNLHDLVGGFKVGPRLVLRYGSQIIQELAAFAPVFVDCKFFDIPSTMVSAVRAAFEAGASVVTVHAMAGIEALNALATLEQELNQIRSFRIIAVTILTSWSEESMPQVFREQTIPQHVDTLVDLVKSSGLSGVVCSAEEVFLLQRHSMFLLTPGIRLPTDDHGDQKRVMGPAEAMRAGAKVLVVGRPILSAASPRAAAAEFLAEIYKN